MRDVGTDRVMYYIYCRSVASRAQLFSGLASDELLKITGINAPVKHYKALTFMKKSLAFVPPGFVALPDLHFLRGYANDPHSQSIHALQPPPLFPDAYTTVPVSRAHIAQRQPQLSSSSSCVFGNRQGWSKWGCRDLGEEAEGRDDGIALLMRARCRL